MLSKKFKKSSSCGIGACIEVRKVNKKVDIKNCEGQILRCSHESWEHFIQGVKAGEFDI